MENKYINSRQYKEACRLVMLRNKLLAKAVFGGKKYRRRKAALRYKKTLRRLESMAKKMARLHFPIGFIQLACLASLPTPLPEKTPPMIMFETEQEARDYIFKQVGL